MHGPNREHHRLDAADPGRRFDDAETTISHLFRAPHPALGGRSYGEALCDAVLARGLLPAGGRVVEVGGGLGDVAAAMAARLPPDHPYVLLELSPRLRRAQRRRLAGTRVRQAGADAAQLPVARGAAGLLLCNEVIADLDVAPASAVLADARLGADFRRAGLDSLAPATPVNAGALALLQEAARVLAPGGAAVLTEFGGDGPVVPVRLGAPTVGSVAGAAAAGHHTEHTICWPHLSAFARGLGLKPHVEPLARFLGFDGSVRALGCNDLRRLRWLLPRLPMLAIPADEFERRHPWLAHLAERPRVDSPRFPESQASGGLFQLFFALIVRRARGAPG